LSTRTQSIGASRARIVCSGGQPSSHPQLCRTRGTNPVPELTTYPRDWYSWLGKPRGINVLNTIFGEKLAFLLNPKVMIKYIVKAAL
jgi:hypothetical protein